MENNLSYLEVPEITVHHHALKIDDNKYYHFFVIEGYQFTTITEGKRDEAMKTALYRALDFHSEIAVHQTATYSIISNAVDVATSVIGEGITVIDNARLAEIRKRVKLKLEKDKKEERKERLRLRRLEREEAKKAQLLEEAE